MDEQWREIEDRLREEMDVIGDFEKDIVLEEEERRIKRVLKEAGIADMSDGAWNVVWSCAVWDVHPTRTSGQLSPDELRTAEAALAALGVWE